MLYMMFYYAVFSCSAMVDGGVVSRQPESVVMASPLVDASLHKSVRNDDIPMFEVSST